MALHPYSNIIVRLTSVLANTTISVPAGYQIVDVVLRETAGNGITGGIKIGTTSGGTDVVVALTVGANFIGHIPDASLLKKFFSETVDTTLFIQTVTLWNSASVNITFLLAKIMP